MKSLVFALLAFCSASCVEQGGRAANHSQGKPAPYSVNDSPSEHRLYLTYRNESSQAYCFDGGNWPASGILINNGSRVFLDVAGARYYLKSEDDYCLGCNRTVAPGTSLKDFLPYESFGLPAELWSAEKRLTFTPIAFPCARR